ncbi:uncharacterized protein C3orf85 homolog isoform X2 [Rhinatrema bivittatum]|uniref:uncharacterized protein C3orf85 homolog isoform X2 n=1 Tax=Rhinatrema bivittatum TaxID=194408 RepID=UPI00112D6823|nr:uncharacterized protein C3orf85 homolog isoform X2 [Rhinatrema bivittatum]
MTGTASQIILCAVLLTEVLGAPFLPDETANQFLRLKRQAHSWNYWDPEYSQNAWGYTVTEQVSEYWNALRTMAQYYMDLGSFAIDPTTAQGHIKAYMEMLRDTSTHLQRQAHEQS